MKTCDYCGRSYVRNAMDPDNYAGACIDCHRDNNPYTCTDCGAWLDRHFFPTFHKGGRLCEECNTKLDTIVNSFRKEN